MAEQFRHLFTPIKIGPVTVRNRIVVAPHGTLTGEGGLPSERGAYYYAERAKGGVGLVTIEGVQAAPKIPFIGYPDAVIRAYDERSIPGFRLIASMVHEHGAKVFCEIMDMGIWGGSGPSTMPDLRSRITASEMTVEEIQQLVDYYGLSTRYLREAGVDGVELHASHGVGLAQFISPLYNHRTDRYGGSLEKRMTCLVEVVDCVRQVLGTELALGVRLDVDEMYPNGNTLEDGKRIAQFLEATGKVDYLSIDTAVEPHQSHVMTASMYAPHGHMVFASAAVKEAVERIPVGIAGRIVDPLHAEKILADGHADLIIMARALLADPELPNKARAGRLADIRTCLGDNENCAGRVWAGVRVACTVNPSAAEEKELGIGTLQPATTRKKVLVAGGGPAGMEAARVAALRGHKVVLYEKEETLGGQINLAALLPGRSEIGGIVRWLQGQLTQLGVETHLGHEMTAPKVLALRPDAVVVATGGAYYRNGLSAQTFAPVAGWDQDNVATPEEVLSGGKPAGQRVVILDQTGFLVGMGLGEWLADQGKTVEILTSEPFVGSVLPPTLQLPWVYARVMAKVSLTPHTTITQIAGHTVATVNVHSLQQRTIEDVDTVVLVTAKGPNDMLWRDLKGQVAELHLVGDANRAVFGARGIADAIRAGHLAGREI